MSEMRALVVEVDAPTRTGLFGFLRRRGYQCVAASSATEALDALADGSFSFTLVDLDGNGTDPAEQIRNLKVRGRNSGPIIAVADRVHNLDAAELAVEVVLPKPLNLDELQQVLDTVIHPVASDLSSGPEQTAGRLTREMDLWRSPKMLDARQILHEAARVDVTVLITGETGTGKDLIARAIHYFSSRRAGPFIKVNCAAMPRELLESELFGYERGAFTGAHKDGEFSRIGAKTTLSVDVRVLAATNQDLERAVEEGRFREDLYYRLNVINMCAPPLRERAAEIPLLANYFVERYAKLYRRDGFAIAPAVMERLTRHPFPGNVRELENLVKRMIVLDDPFLVRVPLPDPVAGAERLSASSPPPPEPSLKEIARRASRAAEREAITKMLERTSWNRVRAARALRISYRALLYKIKEAGLDAARSSARRSL
ncbi:MAG: hypothetical protein DME07_20970 [Candidatus Rokuibacteriota bacterium]|nr:MAG: hypothetical protein DME07_20970 [Candidatus Rokubacteria bacterium]